MITEAVTLPGEGPALPQVGTDRLPCLATLPNDGTALVGSGDIMAEQSEPDEFAGFRLHHAPHLEPHGWLGPVLASAPAVRISDGTAATAHVVVGKLGRPARKRFHAEAARMRAAHIGSGNPFVCELLDHATDTENRPALFTTPFGPSLAAELAATGPFSMERTLAVAADAVAGLRAVHQTGEPHRAVSPQALFRGADDRVQLAVPALPMLAELAAEEEGTGHEPPEVLAGNDWTLTGDVYALASSLWTLLTGKTADVRERLERANADTPPVMPRADVPNTVVSALAAAMAADPADRPASPAELLAALTRRPGEDTLPPDTLPPDIAPPVDGSALGSGYQILERIGQGSSGRVFRVRRHGDGTELAAKFLDPGQVDQRTVVSRFFSEHDVLERLDHPNLLKVHDFVVERRRIAIVMDLVDGPDLRQLIGSGPLARTEARQLLGQVASALAAMHASGVIHRDVKPENVVVAGSARGRSARLVDFGLAKMRGQPTITRQHALLGTLAYIAPELAAGQPATTASDVYALGVTGYEVLAGRRPFDADNELAWLHAHLTVAPPRPARISDEEWALLSACLAKDPTARPTAQHLADALAALVTHTAAAGVTPPVRDEPVGTTTSFELTTEQAPLPGPEPMTEPAGSNPTDNGILQSTMEGRRACVPVAPEQSVARRRWWPITVGASAVAVIGTSIGVLLAAQADDPGEPRAVPVRVRAAYEPDGTVLLDWSSEVEQQPGFQTYQILRDGKPLDELPAGETSYLDVEAGSSPCYTVLALGVSESDATPGAVAACPKR